METLAIFPDITDPGCVREFAVDEVGQILAIGALPNGTSGGKPAIHFVLEIQNEGELEGLRVRGFTTLRLLRAAVNALEAEYPGLD